MLLGTAWEVLPALEVLLAMTRRIDQSNVKAVRCTTDADARAVGVEVETKRAD